jgi:regulator of protease activity HflC (stomatin/prohibitin superfamily)
MLLDNALQLATISLWSAFAIFIVIYIILVAGRRGVFAAVRGLASRLFFGVLIVLTLVSFINSSAVFIEPQQVGVVISVLSPNGYYTHPYRSGLRWIFPFLEHVERYPVSWQTYTMAATPNEGQKLGDDSIKARTSDGQEVSLDCSLIFQIDPDQVMQIHVDWQGRYIDDFVRPVTRGMVRTLVSQYKADEVNSSRRLDLERDINKQLHDTFLEKGFVLDRFILRNIMFSPEYATAIEQKQVALQGVIENEHKADQIRQLAQGEADAVILKAKADADAVKLKADAEAEAVRKIGAALANDQNVLTYRYIDKLAPNVRVMLVPNNAPYLLPMPNIDDTAAVSPTRPVTGTPTVTPTLPITVTKPVIAAGK